MATATAPASPVSVPRDLFSVCVSTVYGLAENRRDRDYYTEISSRLDSDGICDECGEGFDEAWIPCPNGCGRSEPEPWGEALLEALAGFDFAIGLDGLPLALLTFGPHEAEEEQIQRCAALFGAEPVRAALAAFFDGCLGWPEGFQRDPKWPGHLVLDGFRYCCEHGRYKITIEEVEDDDPAFVSWALVLRCEAGPDEGIAWVCAADTFREARYRVNEASAALRHGQPLPQVWEAL
jgi:hypothetical protein